MKKKILFLYLVLFLSMSFSQNSVTDKQNNSTQEIKIQNGTHVSPSKTNYFITIQSHITQFFSKSLQATLSPYQITILLFAALIYGILHALGPGHQKTLITGYLLSEGKSYKQACITAAASSASHAFSVILVFSILVLLEQGLNASNISKSSTIASKISGVLLAIIVVYTIKRKIKQIREGLNNEIQEQTCIHCNTNKNIHTKKSFFSVIIVGSLIPCPGSSFFLITAFTKGSLVIGIISVLIISIGMFITLLATAFIALAIQKKSLILSKKKWNKHQDMLVPLFGIVGNIFILLYAFLLIQ